MTLYLSMLNTLGSQVMVQGFKMSLVLKKISHVYRQANQVTRWLANYIWSPTFWINKYCSHGSVCLASS